jgi:hypothetical protein
LRRRAFEAALHQRGSGPRFGPIRDIFRVERDATEQKAVRSPAHLELRDGLTDQDIADDLEAGLVTVERVRKRYCERGLEATLERKPQTTSRRRDAASGDARSQ